MRSLFELQGAQPDDDAVARSIRRNIEAYGREDSTMAFGWSFDLAIGMVADAIGATLRERDEIVAHVTLVLSERFMDLRTGNWGAVEDPTLAESLIDHDELLLGSARNMYVVQSETAPRSLLRWDSVEGDRAVLTLPAIIEPPADPRSHDRRR